MGTQANQAVVFENVIRPAFHAVLGVEPHKGHALEGISDDAWSALHRQKGLRHTVVVTVDLDATGGVVAAHPAHEEVRVTPAIVALAPGINAAALSGAIRTVLSAWGVNPPSQRSA